MAGSTIAKLGSTAAEHWGMITTAQAAEVGVSRKTLSNLAASGALQRLAQGVYRMAGAPEAQNEIDAIRVHWLALGGFASIVAAGKSAAALHEVGDWFPDDSNFISPVRRTTRLEGIRLRTRAIDSVDVVNLDGIPTMTIERMIADLVETREDPSLIADALGGAIRGGILLHPKRLAELLCPLAHRNAEKSGTTFAARLLISAGADESWISRLQ